MRYFKIFQTQNNKYRCKGDNLYLVIEIEFNSNKDYISKIIDYTAKSLKVDLEIVKTKDKIVLISNKDEPNLEKFLTLLETNLPASIYLGESSHKLLEQRPEYKVSQQNSLPLDLSLCPTCQKEMFDVSSRRYYYPFTSCGACGSGHSFLEKYPYSRENSSMKFLTPCKSCQEEMKNNPFRENYPLISCIECGINIKMRDKKSERYANDKGSFKKLFEVAAKAIQKGKKVVIRGTFGNREFFIPTKDKRLKDSVLFLVNASKINLHLMMIPQEFNALLSIERPLIRISTKSKELKDIFGSSAWCKYPDDGMSMLLAKELSDLGIDYIAYRECSDDVKGDFLVDFDLPYSSQKDLKIFINQDTKLLISGERTIFPQKFFNPKRGRVVISCGLVSLDGVVDKRERFSKIPASEIYIKVDEPVELDNDNAVRFDGFKASMLSVLAEHNRLDQKAIGVHFEDRLHFLYYNEKEVIDVVPPKPFSADNLFKHLSDLRDGSDRLVDNFKTKFPLLYDRLDNLNGQMNLFEVVAIVLELEDESFDGISAKALEFMGKGGVLIDTKIDDNRFDDYAFLASLISFKLTDADVSLLCYSLYESFGDYIADIVTQLTTKTKTTNLTLSGSAFSNQSLWGRIQRNMGHRELLLNRELPIGKEGEVYGANFL